MDALQTITPLLGVIVGGMLAGVGSMLRGRRERKRTIATALSDLLEVRHRILAFDFAIREIAALTKIQPEIIPAFRNQLEELMPIDSDLDSRYNDAVTVLAGADPVLAFRLRSKNLLPGMLKTLRTIAVGNREGLAEFERFEATFKSAAIPKLNLAVVELAKAHSFHTASQVRRLIKDTESSSHEVGEILAKFMPSINLTCNSRH